MPEGESIEGVAFTSSMNTYNFVNTSKAKHDDSFKPVKTKVSRKCEVKIKKELLQREYKRNKPYNPQNHPKQQQVLRLIPPVEDSFVLYETPTEILPLQKKNKNLKLAYL